MLSNMLNDLAEAMKALDGKKADFLHFGASDFPSKNTFKKCFKIVFFFALASRSGFGAAISDAVARGSIVFCNSVSADRIVMAEGCAGCIRNTIVFCWISQIVLKWLHEGCDNNLSADFLHFGAGDFPCKNAFKKCFKIVFFSLWRRDPVLELQFPTPLRSSFVFCNSVSTDRIVMAASRLLRAVAAFVILLSFEAKSRKSYCRGGPHMRSLISIDFPAHRNGTWKRTCGISWAPMRRLQCNTTSVAAWTKFDSFLWFRFVWWLRISLLQP